MPQSNILLKVGWLWMKVKQVIAVKFSGDFIGSTEGNVSNTSSLQYADLVSRIHKFSFIMKQLPMSYWLSIEYFVVKEFLSLMFLGLMFASYGLYLIYSSHNMT